MPSALHALVTTVCLISTASAQQIMQMAEPHTLSEGILQHTSSGTSIEPSSTPKPMVMVQRERWTLMLHGEAFIADIQQHAAGDRGGGGRGGDKLFSTNWIMPMAQHPLGRGQLTLRAMLSLEPATITQGYYPELFQQGETAGYRPIVDGQHPHDFVMELAALYDRPLSAQTLFSLYAAPVGDPAIGPTAYPHRESASADPIAALGHHQQDSTHIAFNVLTAGLTHRNLRAEASIFHGAEPTEARWQPEPSPNGLAPDSYSTRLTWAPTLDLAAQYSIAHLRSPEALHLDQNQVRQTASVSYNRPFAVHHDTASMPGMDMASAPRGNWSTTLLWGQSRSLPASSVENSYLLETLLKLRQHSVWTRMEVAARTSELLRPPPPIEQGSGHVQAYTFGYAYDLPGRGHLIIAPGAQVTLYRTPDSLTPTYGRAPVSAVFFLRLRLAN